MTVENDKYDVAYRCDCCDSLYSVAMSRPTGVWLGRRVWTLCPNCVAMVENFLKSHGPDKEENMGVFAYDPNTKKLDEIQERLDMLEKHMEEFDKLFCKKEEDGPGEMFADDAVYKPNEKDVPRVLIGYVKPLPGADLTDKEWPKKVLEEAAEVYSAWEKWMNTDAMDWDALEEALGDISYECCDVIQTCANMLYACAKSRIQEYGNISCVDVTGKMKMIEDSNRRKGRYDA